MKTTLKSTIYILVSILILSGCASIGETPEITVSNYLNAMVEHDSELIATLSTADWEMNAYLDVDSLTNVEANLDELSCETISLENDLAQVVCSGALILSYDNEQQEIQMDQFTYHLEKVNGRWLVDDRK